MLTFDAKFHYENLYDNNRAYKYHLSSCVSEHTDCCSIGKKE